MTADRSIAWTYSDFVGLIVILPLISGLSIATGLYNFRRSYPNSGSVEQEQLLDLLELTVFGVSFFYDLSIALVVLRYVPLNIAVIAMLILVIKVCHSVY